MRASCQDLIDPPGGGTSVAVPKKLSNCLWLAGGLAVVMAGGCEPSKSLDPNNGDSPSKSDDDDDDAGDDDDDDDGDAIKDEANLCFSGATSTRLSIEVSWPCGSDHDGASLDCTASIDPENNRQIVVESLFIDGVDPNDACADDLVATCSVMLPTDGEYLVLYGDSAYGITAPGMPAPACRSGEDTDN